MPAKAFTTLLFNITLDKLSVEPLHRQLYTEVRTRILEGSLRPNVQIPPSRRMAQELGCSRNTIVLALDQLVSEGYLQTRSGSGTFVSPVLPEQLLTIARNTKAAELETRHAPVRLSRFGEVVTAIGQINRQQHTPAFNPNMPEISDFPFELWSRLFSKLWRSPQVSLVRNEDPKGYRPLRVAISKFLAATRGVVCEPEQIVITSGSTQAIDLVGRLLLDPGARVWVEEPGWPGLRKLETQGVELVPVPVDEEGFSVSKGMSLAEDAQLAIVTPSHQFPLGHVMSLKRRLELLDWASSSGAWVVEDDYNSDFRYAGPPLSALQALDRGGRVIYVGTFSKTLFPSLRLGYIVLPSALADHFASARFVLDLFTSVPLQAVLAQFIDEGHLSAHLRRMRRLYEHRQTAFLEAADKLLGDALSIAPQPSGLHLTGYFSERLAARFTDKELGAAAAKRKITVRPLSNYYLGTAPRQGVLLGYAAVNEGEINRGLAQLNEVIEELLSS